MRAGVLLGAADRLPDPVRRRAGCFGDARDPRLVEHSGAALVGQRAFGLARHVLGVWFPPIWLSIRGGYVRNVSDTLAADDAPTRIMAWFAGAR
jgi:hypothetical protein